MEIFFTLQSFFENIFIYFFIGNKKTRRSGRQELSTGLSTDPLPTLQGPASDGLPFRGADIHPVAAVSLPGLGEYWFQALQGRRVSGQGVADEFENVRGFHKLILRVTA